MTSAADFNVGGSSQITRRTNSQTWTIANGATVSDALDMQGVAGGGFQLPAAFTGATVSFQVSADGTTYTALNDSSNAAVSRTVTQAKAYALPDELFGWRYVKIVSASAEGAARSILVSLSG